MRGLKFYLDRKSLETFHLTFIRPVLETGAIVQTIRSKNMTKYIEEAARIVTGVTNYMHFTKKYIGNPWKLGAGSTDFYFYMKCLIISLQNIFLPDPLYRQHSIKIQSA